MDAMNAMPSRPPLCRQFGVSVRKGPKYLVDRAAFEMLEWGAVVQGSRPQQQTARYARELRYPTFATKVGLDYYRCKAYNKQSRGSCRLIPILFTKYNSPRGVTARYNWVKKGMQSRGVLCQPELSQNHCRRMSNPRNTRQRWHFGVSSGWLGENRSSFPYIPSLSTQSNVIDDLAFLSGASSHQSSSRRESKIYDSHILRNLHRNLEMSGNIMPHWLL